MVLCKYSWNCKWKNNNKKSNVYKIAMSYERPYHNFVSFVRCKKGEITIKYFIETETSVFVPPIYWYSMVDIVRILFISFLNVNVETFIFDDIKNVLIFLDQQSIMKILEIGLKLKDTTQSVTLVKLPYL